MKARDIFPGWLWALMFSGALAAHGVQSYRLNTERLAHQTTKTAFSTYQTEAERASREAEARNRQTEQELRDAQDAHAKEVAAIHLDLDSARARAAGVAGRMQVAVAAAAAQARAGCAAATPADLRTATGDPIGVLADVLGRADTRAGILADIADRRGIAGRACEREYDQARNTLKE